MATVRFRWFRYGSIRSPSPCQTQEEATLTYVEPLHGLGNSHFLSRNHEPPILSCVSRLFPLRGPVAVCSAVRPIIVTPLKAFTKRSIPHVGIELLERAPRIVNTYPAPSVAVIVRSLRQFTPAVHINPYSVFSRSCTPVRSVDGFKPSRGVSSPSAPARHDPTGSNAGRVPVILFSARTRANGYAPYLLGGHQKSIRLPGCDPSLTGFTSGRRFLPLEAAARFNPTLSKGCRLHPSLQMRRAGAGAHSHPPIQSNDSKASVCAFERLFGDHVEP